MECTVSPIDGRDRIALGGDVDLASSPKARKAILAALSAGRGLLVDLSAVTYIDSSGVATLVEGFQRAREQGLPFALVGVSESARRVLQLAHLDRIFPIFPDVGTALADGG
ncbi:STAS domain-containing protein [Endothiovibrio diazotrophicus]